MLLSNHQVAQLREVQVEIRHCLYFEHADQKFNEPGQISELKVLDQNMHVERYLDPVTLSDR